MTAHEEITLTVDGRPVATLVRLPSSTRRCGGFAKGRLMIIKDDDEHLADFEDI